MKIRMYALKTLIIFRNWKLEVFVVNAVKRVIWHISVLISWTRMEKSIHHSINWFLLLMKKRRRNAVEVVVVILLSITTVIHSRYCLFNWHQVVIIIQVILPIVTITVVTRDDCTIVFLFFLFVGIPTIVQTDIQVSESTVFMNRIYLWLSVLVLLTVYDWYVVVCYRIRNWRHLFISLYQSFF